MKKISLNKYMRRGSAGWLLLAVATLVFASCKKDKTAENQVMVAGTTSVRLVHSSFAASTTPADLYVDDAKVSSATAIAFNAASGYTPVTAGSRKISAKAADGTLLADTTINIVDGRQYSFFIKDRMWLNTTTNAVAVLKNGLIATADNNTTVPVAGLAKVRFVNATSLPLNALPGQLTIVQVNPIGSVPATVSLTQLLGLTELASDYAGITAGAVTFRAYGATSSIALLDPVYNADISATVEAGKLYTVYITSTPYIVKTVSKAPFTLKIVSNN